jgi:hypothetical protein
MGCLLTKKVDVSCETKTNGGIKTYVWAFNLSDLSTPIDVGSPNPISSLSFSYGKGLLKLQAFKKSFDAGHTPIKDAAGRRSYNHSVTTKLYSDSSQEDLAIDELIKASELVFIVPTLAKEFKIYGGQNGCEYDSGQQTQGFDNTADTSNNLTFIAEGEEYLPARFLNTDYATSLAILETYEI